MISITKKMNAVRQAAACGTSDSALRGIGLSGVSSVRPGIFEVLPLREVDERPTKAPVAAAGQASAYAFAANGAGFPESTVATTQQHQMMRAFRGLEPWRDPS